MFDYSDPVFVASVTGGDPRARLVVARRYGSGDPCWTYEAFDGLRVSVAGNTINAPSKAEILRAMRAFFPKARIELEEA
jgi:hypothetical protein